METYSHAETDEIEKLLIGRRIVSAEKGRFDLPGEDDDNWWYEKPEGKLTLDDGTVLYLAGNEGGCSCGAGDYELTKLAAVDNVITGVTVEARPTGDEYIDWDTDTIPNGTYKIFVFAGNEQIEAATFEGSDGNGYYGSGFSITVYKP